MAILIGIICFFYLLLRINSLEDRVRKLSKGGAQVSSAQEQMSVPVPPEAQPLSLASLSRSEAPTPPIPHPIQHKEKSDLNEFAVGSKVLTGVGILAILLGVGFFLRYAFERDLITEPMRVFLGIILGLIMAGIGHLLHKKFASYGSGLVGGGVGVIYLTIYAAYAFYGLVSVPIAFVLLAAIIVGSITMALAYNSLPLVVYSFIGAYIMPLLLPISSSVHGFFMYLVVFNLAVLIIARQKVWPALTVGSLIGTSLLCVKWITMSDVDVLKMETVFYFALIFFIYFMTSLINFIKRDRDYKGIDGFLIYAIPVIYYLLNISLIDTEESLTLFTFGVGIFYVLAAIVIRALLVAIGEIKKFTNSMIVIAGSFIAGAIALHFEGNSMTLLWALQALVMLVVGHTLQSSGNRIAAIVLGIIASFRLVLVNSTIATDAPLIFNGRTFIFAAVGLLFAVMWYYYWSFVKTTGVTVKEGERDAGRYIGAIHIAFLSYVWITLELFHSIKIHAALYLPLAWIIVSILLIGISFIYKERVFRFSSYVALAFIVPSILVTLWSLPTSFYQPILNIRLFTVLAFALAAYLIIELMKVYATDVSPTEKSIRMVFLVTTNFLLFWGISLDVLNYFNQQKRENYSERSIVESIENTKRVMLSIVWLVYAVVSLGVGIVKRSVFARQLAILLFGITIFKIFLYDVANTSDVYRVVSFISLGVILLLVGYAYYRFRDRIQEFVTNK